MGAPTPTQPESPRHDAWEVAPVFGEADRDVHPEPDAEGLTTIETLDARIAETRTVEAIAEMVAEMQRNLGAAVSLLSAATERADNVVQIVLARIGQHFSIDETAAILKTTPRTVKRKINRGELTLEQIPGTHVYGIPANEVFAWAPAKVLRAAAERGKTR